MSWRSSGSPGPPSFAESIPERQERGFASRGSGPETRIPPSQGDVLFRGNVNHGGSFGGIGQDTGSCEKSLGGRILDSNSSRRTWRIHTVARRGQIRRWRLPDQQYHLSYPWRSFRLPRWKARPRGVRIRRSSSAGTSGRYFRTSASPVTGRTKTSA